jgi:CDP-diacylglycerol---serine O-phosphatidyltransferase
MPLAGNCGLILRNFVRNVLIDMTMFSWSVSSCGTFRRSACAAFRLARFNVQIGVVDKRYFIGVASPLAAVMIISLVWVGLDFPEIFDIKDSVVQIINAVAIVITGLLIFVILVDPSYDLIFKKLFAY